ncbi:unnamed protein product [Clavelina lepadiformis]|uniref:ATP synthase F0 subunit 8 n=1 Tax=Clavelina lepadiformis TaxID=159417 RepID=A0ABP0GR97_CLALP
MLLGKAMAFGVFCRKLLEKLRNLCWKRSHPPVPSLMALLIFTLLVLVSSVRVGQYVIKFNKQMKIEFLWKTAESGGIIAESESSKDVREERF